MLKPGISRNTLPAWALLVAALLATVFASLQVKQSIEQEEVRRFAFACDQVVLEIKDRLNAYALILRGGAALFTASKEVDRDAWRAYVETLRAEGSVPGVQGIGFAQVIPASELATHVARIRGEGFPAYTVKPVGNRALYTAIIYLEPFRDRNLRAFGYDMFSEPVRRAAMEQARDSGEAALSGKVKLVQETGIDVQAGTLMYVPVYRNGIPTDTSGQRRAALIGWAYSPYRMNDLMLGILGDWQNQDGQSVALHIYDGLQATPATLLYDSKTISAQHALSPIHQQRTVAFKGHPWLLEFDRTSATLGVRYASAWAMLTGGVALSGLLFWLMLSMSNTRASAQRIAIELTEEIRGREEVTQAASQYARSLIEASLDPLVTISAEGEITDVNQATEKITGRNRSELIGTEFCDYFTEPDQARTGYQHVFAEGFVTDYPLALRHRDGHATDVLYNASVYRNEAGEVLGVFAAARDITELKRAIAALRALKDDLEIRVAERTAQLEAANKELEAFSYSVSHDLRTPLRAIDGFSHILLAEYTDKLDDEGKRLLKVVRDNTSRMGQLIDDILKFSRAGRLEIASVEIDMEELTRAVCEELRPTATGHQVQVEIEHLSPATGDRSMMRQVLVNLLSNAFKFTRFKEVARIKVGSSVAADEVTYFVQDNGVGFDMQFVGKLFGVFQRLHSVTEFEGTGIGLAIVKRIVTRHGGRVWAQGKVNEGATIYFALPAKEKEHE